MLIVKRVCVHACNEVHLLPPSTDVPTATACMMAMNTIRHRAPAEERCQLEDARVMEEVPKQPQTTVCTAPRVHWHAGLVPWYLAYLAVRPWLNKPEGETRSVTDKG